jgi:hypothetical protein
MKNDRILDFLRATIDASPELAAPTVETVRLQVRTGSGIPPKPTMFEDGYMVMRWTYRVVNAQDFHNFLRGFEASLAQNKGYHGTFAVRGAGGTPTSRFNTLWGGKRDFLEMIENCFRGRPNFDDPDERFLADLMSQLLRRVSDEDIEVELLDPSIGLGH